MWPMSPWERTILDNGSGGVVGVEVAAHHPGAADEDSLETPIEADVAAIDRLADTAGLDVRPVWCVVTVPRPR